MTPLKLDRYQTSSLESGQQRSFCYLKHRVGSGVTPAASHTTGHTVPYHGGSLC